MYTKIKFIFVLLFFLFSAISSYAQKEADNWYFGDYAGMSFKDGQPRVLLDGALKTLEGCATISDSRGNLLFYTDGLTVWNSQHQIMANDLTGHSSSTQSAVIIPKPGVDSIYFIFTVDYQQGTNGFRYSIVDMKRNNGLGAVTIKNQLLLLNNTEKVTAIKHKNNIDFWVVTHEFRSNAFYAYLLTESGIDEANPVVSNIGSVIDQSNSNKVGYLKASPEGNKIINSVVQKSSFELFDFDNSTGRLSNCIEINSVPLGWPYGAEFSSDGSLLYVSKMKVPSTVYQFDLSVDSADRINKSAYIVASTAKTYYYGALQLAPDGKIYVAQNGSDFLGVINQPSKKNAACNFAEEGFNLRGKTSRLGLPTFMQSYFSFISVKANSPLCEGDTLYLQTSYFDNSSFLWEGPNGFLSTEQNPVIENVQPEMSGTYRLTLNLNGQIYTKEIDVIISEKPDAQIDADGKDYFCAGESMFLRGLPEELGMSYKWSTGETFPIIEINQPGNYSLFIENEYGCLDTAYIDIAEIPSPDLSIANEDSISLCEGESVLLEAISSDDDLEIVWSTGQKANDILVDSAAVYYAYGTNANGCTAVDSVVVSVYPNPQPEIIGNKFICENGVAQLSVMGDYVSYLWSTGETSPEITVADTGKISLTVTDENGCIGSSEISIQKNEVSLYLNNCNCMELDSAMIGESSSGDFVFTNTSGSKIRIENIRLAESDAGFEISAAVPVFLDDLQTWTVNVVFRPEKNAVYSNRFAVEISEPCIDTFFFDINAAGYGRILVSMPHLTAEAGQSDFCIPIKISSGFSAETNPMAYQTTVAFPWDAFLPENVSAATILKDTIIGKSRVLTLAGEIEILEEAEKTLLEICGTALLALNRHNPLEFIDFTVSDSLILIDTLNGSLTSEGVCQPDLRPIISAEYMNFSCTPNPASDLITIDITNVVSDETHIRIVSQIGETLAQRNSIRSSRQEFDISDFPSGIYFVSVFNQNNYLSKPIVIVK